MRVLIRTQKRCSTTFALQYSDSPPVAFLQERLKLCLIVDPFWYLLNVRRILLCWSFASTFRSMRLYTLAALSCLPRTDDMGYFIYPLPNGCFCGSLHLGVHWKLDRLPVLTWITLDKRSPHRGMQILIGGKPFDESVVLLLLAIISMCSSWKMACGATIAWPSEQWLLPPHPNSVASWCKELDQVANNIHLCGPLCISWVGHDWFRSWLVQIQCGQEAEV
jgi:hypothetical protein